MKIALPGGVLRSIKLEQATGGKIRIVPIGGDYLSRPKNIGKPIPIPIMTLTEGRVVLACERDLELLSGIEHGLRIRKEFMPTDRYKKMSLEENICFWRRHQPLVTIGLSDNGHLWCGEGPLLIEEILKRYNGDKEAPTIEPKLRIIKALPPKAAPTNATVN